jgi:hypothetical protein
MTGKLDPHPAFATQIIRRGPNSDRSYSAEEPGGMPMNSHGGAALARAKLSDVGQRARRRVAYRLLPFVFLLYIVNYIDRVNVSFANLRMSADLGFSDRVCGLGVDMFYITYVLFEIPGAVIVERWSARKWIARIVDFVGNSYDCAVKPQRLSTAIKRGSMRKGSHLGSTVRKTRWTSWESKARASQSSARSVWPRPAWMRAIA